MDEYGLQAKEIQATFWVIFCAVHEANQVVQGWALSHSAQSYINPPPCHCSHTRGVHAAFIGGQFERSPLGTFGVPSGEQLFTYSQERLPTTTMGFLGPILLFCRHKSKACSGEGKRRGKGQDMGTHKCCQSHPWSTYLPTWQHLSSTLSLPCSTSATLRLNVPGLMEGLPCCHCLRQHTQKFTMADKELLQAASGPWALCLTSLAQTWGDN